MFISTEIRLNIGFSAAQDTLADLVRDGLLGRVSGDAYDQWQAGLVCAGPRVTMLGMYRIARVRVTGIVTYGNSALWAMRWEVADRGGALVPALDADLKLTPAGPDATVLTVSGVCPAAAGQSGRRRRPGGHAPGRPGDNPGLHRRSRGQHRRPGRPARRRTRRGAARGWRRTRHDAARAAPETAYRDRTAS